MPTLLETPTESEANPFADLIGGENGAPAYQVVASRFSEVPKAEVVTPTDYGAFADMVPGPGKDVQMPAVEQDLGIFQALVPQSPTAESEKALAETPKPPDSAWIGFEKGIENVTGQPFHQVGNAIRVFGQTAGRYIFDGMQAFERNRAQYYQNPTPEAYQAQGDQILLPDGSRMSPEEEAALEQKYKDELAKHAPAALENAATIRKVWDKTEASIPTDPTLADTVPARLAAAAGPVAVMTAESLVPTAGLPLMVMHGALATEQEALDAGATPEQAKRAAIRSAIGLGIFGGASKIAAASVAKALPWLVKDPSQLTRFVAQFTGQEAANETSSRVIQAWNAAADAPEGQKLQAAVGAATETNLENTVMNTMYALAHAAKASRGTEKPPTSPASEPGPAPAPESGRVPETPQGAEPAREPTPANERPAAMQPVATISEPTQGGETDGTLQIPRTNAEISRAPETGQNQPGDREGVRPSQQGQEAARTPEQEEVRPVIANDWTLATAPDEVKAKVARLLPGEKQGDLISSTQAEDFALVGEKGIDHGERQLKAERDAQAAEEARLRQEHEQELLDEFHQHQARGGDELLDAIKSEGGLPAISSDRETPFRGELQNIREELKNPNRKEKISYNDIFRKDAADEDTLTQRLRAKGFKISSPGELLDMVRERIRTGREVFGNEAMGAEEAFGIVPPGTAQLHAAGAAVAGTTKALAKGARSLKEFHDFRRARLRWSARGQASAGEITRVQKQIAKAIPSPIRRAAITNWIQAGGDMAELRNRAMQSKNLLLRRGYEAALTLTPEEKAVAGKVRQTYDILRKRAEAHGIEINEIENYVNQLWQRNALKDFGTTFGGKKLSTSVRFAKKRFHESFFHGEQAGLTPETKDIAKLLPIYINEVNNAINAKQFVAEMSKAKASDGRPLLAPRGGAKVTEAEGEGKGAILAFPDRATTETSDYKVLDQPALHSWKWVGEENGKPIMLKGDLAVHPEAYSHLKNVLGQSALREWYQSPSEGPASALSKTATKFLLDDVQQIGKATMLGFLSPFHQVQEGTHAIGHKVNPFGGLEKIDLSKPNQRDAAEHGLMLLPDRISAQQFKEGLDGSSRNLVANMVGKLGGKVGRTIKDWSDGYQHYLFHEYIPSIKLKTYDHILERNSKRFAKELASGAATMDQVKFLTAEQTNAAYGHLNYADMGRNPTLQHMAQIFLLAPDFLEARGRFVGQAAKGLVSKTGREQMAAIMTLAATQFVLARILNKTLDDDYHWDEPFGVVVGGRKYTMRSVPEDIYKAYQDWRKFTMGRLSPLIGRGLLEGLSGVNYRNEPTTIGETLTNILAGMMPLTLQPATRGLTETTRDNPVSPFEQFLGSLGLHVSRFSPSNKVYSLAKDWQEANGIERKRGLFPRSKYQQLRYALEDGDFDKAKGAYEQLITDGAQRSKMAQNFRESVMSPFTGSLANDRKFRSSLSPEDRKVYDAAVKRRHDILLRYQVMLKRR